MLDNLACFAVMINPMTVCGYKSKECEPSIVDIGLQDSRLLVALDSLAILFVADGSIEEKLLGKATMPEMVVLNSGDVDDGRMEGWKFRSSKACFGKQYSQVRNVEDEVLVQCYDGIDTLQLYVSAGSRSGLLI